MMNWSVAGSIGSATECTRPAALSSLRFAGESCENQRRRDSGHYGENFVVVVEVESVLVGVGLIEITDDIRLCYVRPGRQRSGVGRAMLQALGAQTRNGGLSEIH